jgi:hypothetical protein
MAEPKKETVRIALPPRPDKAPPAPSSIKRDTARIVLPSRTPVAPLRRLPPKITSLPPADSTTESPTISVRRPPVAPPQVTATSPLLRPLPKPPGSETSGESRAASNPLPAASPGADETDSQSSGGASVQPGPKKETARISILPRPTPVAKPAINMTKTQPLLIQPAAGVQPAPVIISSKPLDPFELLPKSFCWGLFGIASVIFLIQIWNYIVS